MTTRQKADALVAHLAAAAGLGNLALAADGSLALGVDGRFVLHLQSNDDEGTITMFAPLGTVPLEDATASYKTMLRANRFWRGAGGATLSLDEQEPPRAILSEKVHCDVVTQATFLEVVERFIHNAQQWSGIIGESGAGADAAIEPMRLGDFPMGGLRA